MSSFTDPLVIKAAPGGRAAPWWLPPSMVRPRWELTQGFRYFVGSFEFPSEIIDVPTGFIFDGASVPLPFRLFVPMAHPLYIQAAALHDWMIESGKYPRWYCDHVFHEALGVLGMPQPWREAMWVGVRIGAALVVSRRAIGLKAPPKYRER